MKRAAFVGVYPSSFLLKTPSNLRQSRPIIPVVPVTKGERVNPAGTLFQNIIMTTVANSQSIDAGSYLHIRNGSKLRLTRALRPDGKRNWMVQDSSGSQFSVSPKQILFTLKPHSAASLSDDLSTVENLIQRQAEEYEELLELSWEELTSETEPVDLCQICFLLFSDEDPLSLLTTHLLLENDEIFFKSRNIKGTVKYEARPSKHVEEIKLQMLEQARRSERDQSRTIALRDAYSTCSLEPLRSEFSEEEIQTLLSSLRDMAIELENGTYDASNRYAFTAGNSYSVLLKEARALVQMTMSALSKPIVPLSAFQVLVTWGKMTKHENLAILRNNMDKRRTFSAPTLETADNIISNPPPDFDRERRLDLRHLPAYAIDSADTTEVDDAIGFDPESNLIYVHVADPSRYFVYAEDDVLQEAFRRNRTIYLPTEKLTMFPEKLANDLFSLTGESWDGTSLSFSFSVNEDGSIDEHSMGVQTTLIPRPLRLTYEQANEAIGDKRNTEHVPLKRLYQLALQRREWREVEGGAINVETPFAYIDVKNESTEDPEINIGTVRPDTAAWILVSELMITACTVGAFVAKEANLPLPFRSQEPFDYPDDDVIEAIPNGPARAAIVFKNATASMTSTKPNEHASLGLDYYSQVTSPIRRSLDLIAHFQLKALIRGEEAPFTVDDIMREIGRTQDVGRDARILESKTNRYWQLEFLRRKGPNAIHRASFVRNVKDSDRLGLVHFDDYGFQVVAKVSPGTKPGAVIGLRIRTVSPRTGEVLAESVLATEASSLEAFGEIQDDDILSDITED